MRDVSFISTTVKRKLLGTLRHKAFFECEEKNTISYVFSIFFIYLKKFENFKNSIGFFVCMHLCIGPAVFLTQVPKTT